MSNPFHKIRNKTAADIVFAIHVVIFLGFPLGFLIPSSVWSDRIEYHFYYTAGVFLLFYIWGAIWTMKYKNRLYGICALDTLMQWLRGHSMWSPENYEHSFTHEVLDRLGIRLAPKTIIYLIVGSVLFAAIQYLLLLQGIRLY